MRNSFAAIAHPLVERDDAVHAVVGIHDHAHVAVGVQHGLAQGGQVGEGVIHKGLAALLRLVEENGVHHLAVGQQTGNGRGPQLAG